MKISIGKKTVVYPHPVFIIGSYDNYNKPNMMAASWGGICCSEPPCIAFSIRKSRYSYDSILKHQAFTVNIPSEDYVNQADYTGTFSGKNHDKFSETGLTPVKSELISAPYVKEFPINLICKLVHTIELGVHTQFIGEILDTLVDENVIRDDGKLDIEEIKPFCYDSSTRTYYSVGKTISEAYSAKVHK